MKTFGIVLAVWLVLAMVQLAQAEPEVLEPSGCVRSAKTCNCFTPKGKRVELHPQLCHAVTTSAPVKLAGGDMDALAIKPKPADIEPTPFVKPPIPWLIER